MAADCKITLATMPERRASTRKIAPVGSIVSIHGGTKDKPNLGLVVQLYRRRKRPLPRPDVP